MSWAKGRADITHVSKEKLFGQVQGWLLRT